MVATANEQLRDMLLRRQVGLLNVSDSVNNRIRKLIDRAGADLQDQIIRRLTRISEREGVDIAKVLASALYQSIEADLTALRKAMSKDMQAVWNEEMRNLAKAEATFTAGAIEVAAPVVLDLAIPNLNRISSMVRTNPMRGRVLKEWATGLERADRSRILDQVRIGLIEGDSAPEIARRVVGTARLRGTDGVTIITRRNAAAITRTATNHFASQARKELYKANDDIIDEEVYFATLDSATTPICRALDGNHYPVGVGPQTPQHWGCRSLRIAVIGDELIGTRPYKASTEKMLVREYAAANKLTRISSRAKLPRGHKGLYDTFARKRVRELTGVAPAKLTYSKFLQRQSAEFQDGVLGVAKGTLFRNGDLPLSKFVNRSGGELTLKQLAVRERPAFVAAGLDPDKYL